MKQKLNKNYNHQKLQYNATAVLSLNPKMHSFTLFNCLFLSTTIMINEYFHGDHWVESTTFYMI